MENMFVDLGQNVINVLNYGSGSGRKGGAYLCGCMCNGGRTAAPAHARPAPASAPCLFIPGGPTQTNNKTNNFGGRKTENY